MGCSSEIIYTYVWVDIEFTREELLYNYLRIPQVTPMNANIFDNNEDLFPEEEVEEDPTVF